MRFEILETVPTPDREMVLRALEMCSREVSSKVVRYGDRITLQGLGPSPRAKNVRDTTVFRVDADDDKTIISGEVSFQASALLGDQPQGDVVRSKIEELFNQMKAQIGIDELHPVGSALSVSAVSIEADSGVTTDVLNESASTAFIQNQEVEIRPEHSEAGAVEVVSAYNSELAINFERNAESERNVPAEQNVEVEERNVWLDELFSQLKAQGDLEERLALDGVATAPTTTSIQATVGVTDSVVADISEKAADITVSSDKPEEIMIASTEPALAEPIGLEESNGPTWAALTAQNAEVEQNVDLKRRVEPEGNFDLKENAWLEDLFHQMNAQIDVEGSPTAQDVIGTASIDSSLSTTTDDASSISTEGISAKEAAFIDAPDNEPEVMNSDVESNSEMEASVAVSEVAANSKQNAEDSRTSEAVQDAEVESSIKLQPNPELEQSVKHAQSIEAQLTALQEESAKAVETAKGQPSIDPVQSVWLQHVTELDQHARKPFETPPFLVAGAVEEAPQRKRSAKWVTGLVALLLIAAGIFFFLYRSRFSPEVPSAQTIEQPAPVTTDSLPTTEPSHVPDAKLPLPLTKRPVVDPAVQVTDVRVWLDNWAAAMRTRDASAQAAFYADTVNEYVGKYDVSKDAVLKDREATIHMRKGLWTVKMEKVVIVRQTKSEAEVRLVKHFIDEPVPSEIVESFVPTRLKLKRVDGRGWRITSEQDLPSLSAPRSDKMKRPEPFPGSGRSIEMGTLVAN
ncbi:hypothetical protein [Tunturiibacter lichenicola]|uniref:hypothetical protein n=1 Tax=Tunturiibacter lichenicola TaxID=2051959 RepID=UPI003D9B2DC6